MTTNESANANRYGYMNASNPTGLISTVAGGTEGTDGPNLDGQPSRNGRRHGHGGFCPCLQLVAGARALHKVRNNRGVTKGNVFDHGCWNNCIDFWTESTQGKNASINYYDLYSVHQLNNRTFTLQQTMEI